MRKRVAIIKIEEKQKKKIKRLIKRMFRTFLRNIMLFVIGLGYLIYYILREFNAFVIKQFNKLPKLVKIVIIYALVIFSIMNFTYVKKVYYQANEVVTDLVYGRAVKVEEVYECKIGEIACKIYDEGIKQGMTHEQALLTIAISKHETGSWKSVVFKTKNNFGGIMGKNGLRTYSTFQDGLTAYVSLLKNGYFDKGLDTIEKIGAKYCPVGAENDPTGLNVNWIPSVTNIYENIKKI